MHMRKCLSSLILFIGMSTSYLLYSFNTTGGISNAGPIIPITLTALISFCVCSLSFKWVHDKIWASVSGFFVSYLVIFVVLIGMTLIDEDLMMVVYAFPIMGTYFLAPLMLSSVISAYLFRGIWRSAAEQKRGADGV